MKSVPFAVLLALLGAAPGWAVLGQRGDSVTADGERLAGAVRATAAAGFSVQEIEAADGAVVREYLSPGGEVFAVSWRGPTNPDLVRLLGDYYPELQRATRAPGRRHGSLVVRTEH